MARQVFINGVDYNALVESVDFNSGLGEGSSCQIYCISGMPEIPAFSRIEVKMDGSTVFKGYVGAPRETWDGNPPTLFGAQYECYDDGTGFNQYIISGTFSGTMNEIIKQVIDQVKKEYGSFNYTWVSQASVSGVSTSMTFDYTYIYDAFNAIADAYAGHWFVAPQGKIYFFTTSMADVDKDVITIPYKNVQTPYQHDKATDQIINEVIVIGGEGETISTDKWTYSPTNNVHKLQSAAASLTALWGGEPAFLVAEGFTGDPFTPSDNDAAETSQATSGNNRTAASITAVVVHHIAAKNATKNDIYHWHTDPEPTGRGWSDIGYHWYVHKDGNIEACRPELTIGAHCKGHNAYTVGIGCEGDYERYDTKMPQAQFNALINLILDIMSRYKIKKTNLFYHNDFGSTSCPGKYFPKSAINSAVTSGSASGIKIGESTATAPATDGNKRLYYSAADQTLKAIPGYEPANGTVITIEYATTYTVSERFQDTASINRIGRRITQVIADTTILDKATARGQAMAILNRYKNIEERLQLSLVDYQQIYAGDKVYLPWLNKYGLAVNVQGRLWCNDFEDNEIKVEVILQ